jgi:hypothetical protein
VLENIDINGSVLAATERIRAITPESFLQMVKAAFKMLRGLRAEYNDQCIEKRPLGINTLGKRGNNWRKPQ